MLLCGICLWLLLFQGFAAPSLSSFGNFSLRFLAAVSGQWLVCRSAKSELTQLLPALGTSLFAVWGFFLFLTSPSWRHATFGGFLADYAAPAICCWLVWWMYRRYYK